MTNLRIVCDSNVLISALLWIGAPHKILRLAEDKIVFIYTSLPIIEEVAQVLVRPKFIRRIEELKTTPNELVESLLGFAEVVHPNVKVNEVKSDIDDNKILECAVTADAECIVSGDSHLLKLKKYKDIQIVTPQKFIDILK